MCFRSPAEGELVAAAGKLVGSAQRCEARTILQHGSILIGGSQTGARAANDPAAPVQPTRGETTLRAVLGREPSDAELIDAVVRAFQDRLGIRLAPDALSEDELARLDAAEPRFRSPEWTWRR